jgi:Adenylate and Guanylate cyclase catalytic domain
VPLEEVAVGPVGPVFRQVDDLPGPGVELLAVVEVLAQPRAHEQPVPGINGEVSAVEQGMDVRPEQQPVVETVLATGRDGPDMRRLQHRCDVRSADRAATVISIEDHCLEGALAKPVRRQARVAEHRPWPVPGLAEVKFHHSAQEQLQKHPEIWSNRLVGEVVALARDDVGREPGRRLRGGVCWEEADISHEQATDDGVLATAGLDMVEQAPAMGLPPAHIGIHAGPVIFQDGDVYGRTVNIASRLASVAQAGEVVVSEEVARRADGFSYEDMGSVTLKGVTVPMRLFRAAR